MLGEIKQLAQGHKTITWRNEDSNMGLSMLVVALLWGFCFLQFFLPWLMKATCIAGGFFGCNYLAVPLLQPHHHWCCCMCVLPATSVSQDSLNKDTNPWRVTFLDKEIEIRRKPWLHRGEAIQHKPRKLCPYQIFSPWSTGSIIPTLHTTN